MQLNPLQSYVEINNNAASTVVEAYLCPRSFLWEIIRNLPLRGLLSTLPSLARRNTSWGAAHRNRCPGSCALIFVNMES